jgi:tetratricopeptide (TPR) repeat protein
MAILEHKIGGVYARRGDRDLARSHYESALEALEGSGDDVAGDLARLYADLSLLYHGQDEPERATEFARRALELAEDAGDVRAQAQAHNMLGILSGRAGEEDGYSATSKRAWPSPRRSVTRTPGWQPSTTWPSPTGPAGRPPRPLSLPRPRSTFA